MENNTNPTFVGMLEVIKRAVAEVAYQMSDAELRDFGRYTKMFDEDTELLPMVYRCASTRSSMMRHYYNAHHILRLYKYVTDCEMNRPPSMIHLLDYIEGGE